MALASLVATTAVGADGAPQPAPVGKIASTPVAASTSSGTPGSSAAPAARTRPAPIRIPSTAPALRALEVRPTRRDGPLREQNVSDAEVAEIRQVLGTREPSEVLNIGGVVTGCPCEDGAGCSDQVWVVLRQKQRTFGLLLSRIDEHWTIGPVQRWWLRRRDLEANATKLGWREYAQASERLNAAFPSCEVSRAP